MLSCLLVFTLVSHILERCLDIQIEFLAVLQEKPVQSLAKGKKVLILLERGGSEFEPMNSTFKEQLQKYGDLSIQIVLKILLNPRLDVHIKLFL